MRLRTAIAASVLVGVGALAARPALASDAVRVQAEGVAALPSRLPGGPPVKPLTAEALRALRQVAVADGVEAAVLAHAGELAREEVRDDEAALRGALGPLADYALGHGVLADLGVREVKAKPGHQPRPRRATDPIPMEHAWRIEALVDSARVGEALRAAGLALTSAADRGAVAEVVLEAPYDAAGLAALQARIASLGAASVVPRRFEAAQIVLVVRGVPAAVLRQRLATQPPAGFTAVTTAAPESPNEVRIRLTPAAPERAERSPRGAAKSAASD